METHDNVRWLALICVALVALTALPAGAIATNGAAALSPVDSVDGTAAPREATNGTTTTPTTAPTPTNGNGSDSSPSGTDTGTDDNETEFDSPSQADSVRITPVRSQEPYRSVTVAKKDSVFNTTGPAVLFSLSEPLEAARIGQAPAQASVLSGGRAVLVEYADDAAPAGRQSLYTVDLYFEDGSKKAVSLYARQTAVSVAAAELKEFEGALETLRDNAESEGYDSSDPEALVNYLDWVQQRADLVSGFLGPEAMELVATALMLFDNPLFWLVIIAILGIAGYYLRARFGDLLDIVENDPGRSTRKRQQLQQLYRDQQRAATEEDLENVIGYEATYWADAFGVRDPAGLANLFHRGQHVRSEDGSIEPLHGGASDIDAQNPGQSWLEPVLRGDQLATPQQALGHAKDVLKHMETEYNMGHVYRETLDDVDHLLDELRQRNGRGAGPYAGGDD